MPDGSAGPWDKYATPAPANDSPSLQSPSDNWRPLYEEAGAAHGVSPNLVHAVADVESGGDPFAASPAGAKGLMQTMDRTNPEIGIDHPFDPKQSVYGGAKYLRQQLDNFPGNLPSAIAAYNAGPHGDFGNSETQAYVPKVMARLDQLDAQDRARQDQPAPGPWTKYQKPATSSGPWTKYQKAQPTLPVAQRDEAPPPPTPDQNLARNKPYMAASAHDFTTPLPPDQEASFRKWVADNKVPFDPNNPTSDYDMRGYWTAANTPGAWDHLQQMGKIPADMQPGGTKVDPNDGQPHFPDWWKTPYHQTFSNESQFADRSTAPHWTPDDKLVTPDGKVVFDDKAQQKPAEPGFIRSAILGGTGGLRDVLTGAQQTAAMVKTGKPSAAPEPTAEQKTLGAPIDWATTPSTLGIKKAIYQGARGLTGSAPEMGGAVLGGLAGGAAGAELGPGALLTGAAGAGVGAGFVSAAREFAPIYREELDRLGPGKEDEAFNTALKRGATQAGGTALSFALFEGLPLAPFLKNIFVGGRSAEQSAIASGLTKAADGSWAAPAGSMAKQLPAQGAIAAGQTAAENVEDGRPATENIGNAAIMTGVGIAAPAIAHGVMSRVAGKRAGQPAPINPSGETTPPPPEGHGIADMPLPENYAPDRAGPTPPTQGPVLNPGPAPAPPVKPTPAADPVADAQHTLSIIAAGGDPKADTEAGQSGAPPEATPEATPPVQPPSPAPSPEIPPRIPTPAPPPEPAPIVPPVESTPAPDVDGPTPDWMKDNAASAVAFAERLGLTGKIGDLAKAGKTAAEISEAIGGKLSAAEVRAVRDHLGIEAAGPSGGLLAQIPNSGKTTTPPPKSGDFVMLDPAQLNVDPKRFQFKASDPEKGVTGVLRGSDKWEPMLADPITAWQDNEGKYWVANGHQRTDLANRAVAAGQEGVQVPAKVYREADGYTAGQMRALGAFQNIAQGSGTAIDAAKVLREIAKAPTDYQLPTLPPKSALTIQARGLAKLSDEAFGAVVNDVVPSAYAAHVGDMITDPAQQIAAIGMLAKGHPANADQARMMVQDIRNSGFLQDTQSTLFGDEAFSKSLFPERAKVLDGALKTLRGNKAVYRAAVTGEDALTAAGNKMDSQGNLKAKTENEQLIDHLERNATTKGPLSDALTAAARDVADGKPATNAIAGFLRAARQDHASGREVGVERGAEAERDQPPPEAGDAGPIADDNQTGLLAPKGRINTRDQADMFGADQKPRTQVTPPKVNPSQMDMFGRNDAAIQAQAKRDQEGRGALLAKVDQNKADHGLFADRQEGQGSLIDTKPALQPSRSELGNFAVNDNRNRITPGRDLTNQVVLRPGEPAQVTAGKFVITHGDITGHEYLTVVDKDGQRIIHAGTNDLPDRVGIDPHALTGRPDDSVTIHHNHPGGAGFSSQDMLLLWHPAIGHVVAHSDGDILGVSLGDRTYGGRDVNNPLTTKGMINGSSAVAQGQAKAIIIRAWDMISGPRTAEQNKQFQKSYWDVVARIMHADGFIDYVSTRPMHPNVERLLIGELENAGYNPREIAGATRVHTQDEALAALAKQRSGYAQEAGANELSRPATPVDAGSRAAGVVGNQPESGTRAGRVNGERGAAGAPANRREELGGLGLHSGTNTPVTPPPQGLIGRFASKARDLYETGRTKLNEAFTEHFAPLAGGRNRAVDIAKRWANAVAGVNTQFKMIDDRIVKAFPKAADRNAMGKAMDQTSVLETRIKQLRENNAAQGQLGKPMMSAADLALAEQSMRAQETAAGRGIETLPPNQRALVQELADLGGKVWERMRGRGMVDLTSEGLPYYFARFVMQHDDQGNIIKARGNKGGGGGGSDIHEFGKNMSSSGPMNRNHLTQEETLAAARHDLGDPHAFVVQDIRAVVIALARNEHAIAGRDFIDAIKRIGVNRGGVPLIFHGQVPTNVPGVHPNDYFTMSGHPSFQRWMGSGFAPLHVSNEFKGPIQAVLTKPGSQLYQAAARAKGASMSAIMWAPTMHLNVELGRALPLMRGALFSRKLWANAAQNALDPGYMQMATDAGIRPIGQGWRENAVSVAEQSDLNRPPPGLVGKALEAWHGLHQKVLWDNVFRLQLGIFDHVRTQFMNKGLDERSAGLAAAQVANRYAGALPQENLSRWANMTSNLLLFSRSFTLGNLGIMKDAIVGLPRPERAMIEQHAGADVAKSASNMVRRKAQGAVALDVGLAYMATTVLQQMFALGSRATTMGLGPAAQSVYDDWKTQFGAALGEIGHGNLLAVRKLLPQGYNEPHMEHKALLGTKDDGTAVYGRLAVGKVGEEFEGWPTHPFALLANKTSPTVRALLEDFFGTDTLGRKIYNPNPRSFGEIAKNIGLAVAHVAQAQVPLDQIKSLYTLGQLATGTADKGTSPIVQTARTFGPMLGMQVSQGFPGGALAGFNHAIMEGLAYDQQQALPEARKQFINGDAEKARATLEAARVPKEKIRMLMGYMNQEKSAASGNRAAAKRFTPEEQVDRNLTNTGQPLSP